MDILTEIENRKPATVKAKPRIMWCVMRGDGSGYASKRLYTCAKARRFVRLAKHMGVDVYATRFGRV